MGSAQVVETAFTLGWVVVVALILLFVDWAWRKTKGEHMDSRMPGNSKASSVSSGYPFIRGSDLYRRSLAHRNDTAQVRQAMGLPPQHTEAMWRNPLG